MHSYEAEGCNWVPEYGAWMIEATPSRRKHDFLVLSFHPGVTYTQFSFFNAQLTPDTAQTYSAWNGTCAYVGNAS
jgi:hypothetical protein